MTGPPDTAIKTVDVPLQAGAVAPGWLNTPRYSLPPAAGSDATGIVRVMLVALFPTAEIVAPVTMVKPVAAVPVNTRVSRPTLIWFARTKPVPVRVAISELPEPSTGVVAGLTLVRTAVGAAKVMVYVKVLEAPEVGATTMDNVTVSLYFAP